MSRCQLCGFNNQGAVEACAKCGTQMSVDAKQSQKNNRQRNFNSNNASAGQTQRTTPDPKRTQISRIRSTSESKEDLKKTRISTFKSENTGNGDLKKTQVYNPGQGSAAEKNPETNTSDSTIPISQNCLKCSYLLALGDTECPNCGTAQATENNPAAVITNKGKTVNISNINLDESKKVSEPETKIINKIQLLNQAEEVQFEIEGDQLELGRDEIDKDNLTISSESHVQFEYKDGQWFVKNTSTNKATFIQVNQEMPIHDGDKIILGNAIMTFKDVSTEEVEGEDGEKEV